MKETKPRFDKSDNMPLRPRPAVYDPFFADEISLGDLELIPSTPGRKAAKRGRINRRDETWQRCGSGWKRIRPVRDDYFFPRW